MFFGYGLVCSIYFAISACTATDEKELRGLGELGSNVVGANQEFPSRPPKLLKGGGSSGGGGGKGGSSSSSSSSSSKSGGSSSSPSPSRSPFAPSSSSKTYSRSPLSSTSSPSPSSRYYASRSVVASSSVAWSSNSRLPTYYGGHISRPWFIIAAGATICGSNLYSYAGRCR